MSIYIYIFWFIFFLLILAGIWIFFLEIRIRKFEQKLIGIFMTRTDIFPAIHEISRDTITRHEEIFQQVLSLRKKEFTNMGRRVNIEAFLDLQSHIHHEINFIFQICNKNPKLLKDKKFLYIRDVIIERSSHISAEMKKYKKIIQIYNQIILWKNYTLIWYLIPFTKKPTP